MKPHSLSKAELSSSSCITGEGSTKPGVSSFLETLAGTAKQHEIGGYEVVTAHSAQEAWGDLLWSPSPQCCVQLFPSLQAASACHGEHCDAHHPSQFKSQAGMDFMKSIGKVEK